MDSRTFPATPEQLAKVATILKSKGFEVDPTKTSGADSAKGFDISWDTTPTSITINVLKHPPFVEGMFWNEVQDIFSS